MTTDATVWLPYTQMQTVSPPLTVVTTQGCTLTLADGRQLIDGIASWWTACHGYNPPHILQAIEQQSSQLCHVMMGGLVHPQATRLAQRLTEKTPQDLNAVVFSESGSVAVEIAMKIALQFWINNHQPQKNRFIHFEHGYHGDTFFAMSICDPQEGMHRLFNKILPQQYFHPLPTTEILLAHFEEWLSREAHAIAAMVIEPLVQGAGGMKMHSPATLQAICEICQRHGILVIVDEIFTGCGRTGTFFAIEQAGIVPDLMCLSKGLTGGTLPLAATLARTSIFEAFLDDNPEKALMHGTTFMGNALACAAANASLDLFDTEPRLKQVAIIESFLQKELSPLAALPNVKEVRVKGAIGAVQLARNLNVHEFNWFKHSFIEDGIWCRPIGDVVYLAPAFTITEQELNQLTQSLHRRIKEWALTTRLETPQACTYSYA